MRLFDVADGTLLLLDDEEHEPILVRLVDHLGDRVTVRTEDGRVIPGVDPDHLYPTTW